MAIYIQPLWGWHVGDTFPTGCTYGDLHSTPLGLSRSARYCVWHFDKVSTKSVIIRRNPIFWKKSDFSNRAQGAIDLRFLRKIEFFKPCPNVPKKFFGKNRISQTVPKVPKKFLGKIGFLLKWSGLEIFAFVY
jgi:hypothetical protein